MTYRTVEINKDMHRVLDGDELVGYVRFGLDRKWYPMLPHEATRSAAVQRVMLANEAVKELRAGMEAPGGEAS